MYFKANDDGFERFPITPHHPDAHFLRAPTCCVVAYKLFDIGFCEMAHEVVYKCQPVSQYFRIILGRTRDHKRIE